MAGIDSYTKLCLHFNEADGSTTTVDSSLTPKTVTAAGNVQTDSGVTKFGNTSLFDGTGDWWELADSADWQLDGGSDSNAWTIDLWANFAAFSSDQGLVSQVVNAGNVWALWVGDTEGLTIRVRSGASNIVNIAQTFSPSTGVWYHIAIVKDGVNGYMHFIDGTQVGSTTTDTSTFPDYAGVLRVGEYAAAGQFNGSMEEFRISKGIARWTANFTPPTAQYSADTNKINKMMLMGIS